MTDHNPASPVPLPGAPAPEWPTVSTDYDPATGKVSVRNVAPPTPEEPSAVEDRRTFKASQSASGKASRHVLDSLRNDEEEPELIQQWREDPDDISHREGELLNAWQGLLDRLSTAQATVSRLQAEHFNSERAQKALVSLGETVTRLSGENEQLRAALAEKVAECNDIKGIVDAWVQHDAKAAGPCKGCGNPPSQCACFPTDEQVGANRR